MINKTENNKFCFLSLWQKFGVLQPSIRNFDHHINLREGAESVNMQPYWYAYFQKAKIEKQVDEMLKTKII